MKVLTTVVLIGCLFLITPRCKGQQDSKPTDKYILEKMHQFKIPGLSVLVLKDGKVLKKSNYGLTSIEFNIPVTDSTIFQLASVTKIFTSTVIIKLAEAGKLNPDQSVTDFISDLPVSWKAIKIKNLLNHTSGIKNHFQTKNWNNVLKDDQEKLSIRQVIQYSADEPLMFTPGQKWSYGVTGYMILGMIAEKITGKPFTELAEDILYKPLNMTHTAYGDYKAIIKNRNSLVYTYQNGPFETWNFTYGLSGTTAAGLNTTTGDLTNFFLALDAGKVLRKESMNTIMSPTMLPDGTAIKYGLGWVVDEHNGKICCGHEGGGCCWIDYYPTEHLTVIVLSNLTGSKADEIIKGVADYYLN